MPFPAEPSKRCIFEYVYFSRPDSMVFGRNVYAVRKLHGRALARECPVDADSSCRCPIRAFPPRLGLPKNRGCRSNWV